ncbi:alanine dehydrogenase [Candidatus Thioglobus sp.]|jgi:alanine dehydrogenase|uniref:alanine dehydrogenase n=1 Tax=Candidatus Thioglobus sp. TaxID=2026721 RepID=UPI0017577A31|nr:alanine dehydrogenase [Candidatus Thioglobus sp.]HIF46772.1 alanine dehydrogenase [Candidatus Thioglobus sp.]HIL04331.1 alanine dehydrogenase [Candidatus Thioglobus autotrophicus]
MIIGVPKEIKTHEYRTGLTPYGAMTLTEAGHQVIVQSNAGSAIGFSDQDYQIAGASIVDSAETVFNQADMIVKVKEPQYNECRMLRKGQIIFTYLHLAADLKQAQLLIESGAICIAYETVTDDKGRLPLLKPMSEIAGRMSIQSGAHHLEKTQGGSGVLLSGATGVDPAQVLVLGGGVVGMNAAKVAVGMGADVTILNRSILERLVKFQKKYSSQLSIDLSTQANIEQHLSSADLVIGAVLVAGASAPKLITRDMLKLMKKGSVLVDVSIDQGGCFETSIVTTHDKPTYVVDGIIHYCVGNMPGAVAQTATLALTNATLPYVIELANRGAQQAIFDNSNLLNGLNIFQGKVTHQAVAESLDYQYNPVSF